MGGSIFDGFSLSKHFGFASEVELHSGPTFGGTRGNHRQSVLCRSALPILAGHS